HRTEEPAALARPRRQRHLQALELGLDFVGVAEIADLTRRPGPLDRRDLLLAALGPGDREALREKEVAAVAVLHLNDVAGSAEVGYIAGQNDLHRDASPQ